MIMTIFYNYIKVIFYAKYNTRQKSDILFDGHYLNLLSKVQLPSIILERNILIALIIYQQKYKRYYQRRSSGD